MATRQKLLALSVLIAKSAVVFTLARRGLQAVATWLPAQEWLLKPAIWIALSAVFAFYVVAPFIKAIETPERTPNESVEAD